MSHVLPLLHTRTRVTTHPVLLHSLATRPPRPGWACPRLGISAKRPGADAFRLDLGGVADVADSIDRFAQVTGERTPAGRPVRRRGRAVRGTQPRDVRPADLLAAQARLKELSAREGVVEAVHRSIYEQRLQADDQAMGMLLKVARRIDTASEDDPDVRVRWKSVLDFLSKFRRGPSASTPIEEVTSER